MAELPTGTVTFLLTDVEGSTRLWEQHPTAMWVAAARHDTIVEELVAHHHGVLVRPRGEGDSRFAVFARASDAVTSAASLQQSLVAEPWPTPTPLRVRMALLTGEADLREGDYYGTAVNRCARLRGIAHGGQVLVSQTAHDLVRGALPAGLGLRDLGEHRLADLSLPERVFQVLHPALRADFPPPRSLDALPNNLPRQLTSFVGREREVAEVKRLLASFPLVTLTGTGGCGKTRLALQVGADLLGGYADGVWFVDLAPVADPALVPQAVASALGVHELADRPLLATLGDYLRGRDLLLLLDNCEHLLDACAQLTNRLLHACSRLRILATSRELLGIAGETAWRAPSLSLPDSRERLFGFLDRYESSQLFLERARAARPDFTVTHENASALVQICRRLDGIPLAIELAAARVRALSVEQIAARLDDRFRLLTGGSRTALRRQQTLQAAIDWSYQLLSESERILLRRLSVFAGGWTLEAAEAVGAGEGIDEADVLDLLAALVDKSLVVADSHGPHPRYHLLETIRQYAGQKLLDASETAAARDRHLAWFLALSERAEPELERKDAGVWLDRLEADDANIIAALEWSRDTSLEASLRLVGGLFNYWYGRKMDAGLWQIEATLARAPENAPGVGKAMLTAAFYLRERGHAGLARSRRMTESIIGRAREDGDHRLVGIALNNLGCIESFTQSPELARSALEESVALLLEVGDRYWAGASLRDLGHLALREGDDDRAAAMYEQSLSLIRDIGEKSNIGLTLAGIGRLARRQGDLARARATFEEYLTCARLAKIAICVCDALMELGNLDRVEGDLDRAKTRLLESLELAERAEGRRSIAQVLLALAAVLLAQGSKFTKGVRLAGMADAFADKGLFWLTEDRAALADGLAVARAALGQEACDRSWAEGQAMSLEQAIKYALAEDDT
jgi:predicted ATPase/class 3 adenylate cyclase